MIMIIMMMIFFNISTYHKSFPLVPLQPSHVPSIILHLLLCRLTCSGLGNLPIISHTHAVLYALKTFHPLSFFLPSIQPYLLLLLLLFRLLCRHTSNPVNQSVFIVLIMHSPKKSKRHSNIHLPTLFGIHYYNVKKTSHHTRGWNMVVIPCSTFQRRN